MSLSCFARYSFLALAVALGLTAGAQAQQRGRGGFGGFGGGSGDIVMLLTLEPVQTELKLTADQKSKVRESADEWRATMEDAFSGLQNLSQEERREKRTEMARKAEGKAQELRGKIDAVLDAPQKERLKQLSIQRRGAFGAVQDPEVATALKLTDEQKKKVEALVSESRPGRGQGGGAPGGGGAGGGRERFQAMMKERNDKALAILTPEQKAELDKLQGAKFEFPPLGQRGRPGA